MKKIIQCAICLDDTAHPMGQAIDLSGQCSGCFTHQEKQSINWPEKWNLLKHKCREILRNKKQPNGYDCIIPLNADAEDYYVVELALSLGLKPLLVYVNSYFGTDLSWRNLHNLETHFDLDLVTFNPNLMTYKEAIKTSLRKYNSIYWPYQALKTAYPVRLALEYNIPLILWGGLQASEQVGKFSHNDEVQMTGWSRNEHDLLSIEEIDFFGTGAQISLNEQFHYTYPNLKQAAKVTGLYLSNYIRWDPWEQNCRMLKYGFTPEESEFTFDQYERSGSSVFYGIHDLLRFEKFGYRKVRDHLSREIRHGRILKSNAVLLYNEYLQQKIDIKPFFDWVGATESGADLFLKERLSKVNNMISRKRNSPITSNIFFKKDFIKIDNDTPKKYFVIYSKGI